MMDSFYNHGTYSCVVKFGYAKNCFLVVPEKWIKGSASQELAVFRVKYESNLKCIYVSCSKNSTNLSDDESTVYMNKKFAEKLGIKENDTVTLQPMSSKVPAFADAVTLEPLTSDDWEIMELRAQYIANNLINQIRVVRKDQIFPIWVQNSCIYAKVVSCEPDYNTVILKQDSEVRIVPKDRGSSNSSFTNSIKRRRKSSHMQFQCLRNFLNPEQTAETTDSDENTDNSSQDGDGYITNSIASYLLTSWFSPPMEKPLLEDFSDNLGEIFDFQFNSVLRVLPYSLHNTNSNNKLPLVVQATTVFINASTYVACCGDDEIPPCFVGVLEKFSLPVRKPRRGASDNMSKNFSNFSDGDSFGKTSNNSKGDSINGKDSLNGTEHLVNEQKPFDSVCVTVIVVKSAEEDEFNLPASLFTYKNAIVVPKELKRALNLEVSCLVNLKSVHSKPLTSFQLVFHPVSLLSHNVTASTIHENFNIWAFGNKKKLNTYLISDGTLVKLEIHGKKSEFFVHIQEKETSSRSISHSNSANNLEAIKNSSSDDQKAYVLLTRKTLKKASVKIGAVMCTTIYDDRPYLLKENGMYCEIKTPKLSSLGGITELASKAVEDIEFWLKLRPLSYISNHSSTYSGCMLICGPKGVGRTSFANAACKKFAGYPYHVLIRNVQCLPLKGKRVDTIAKKWDDIVSEAIYGQPSLILFEDLDYIASAPLSHEQENGPEGVYFASVSQAFINMMNRVTTSESNVVVMVTSQSLHSLHPNLVNTKGRHIFQSILEVNPPNAEQRAGILRSMLYNRSHISKNTLHSVNVIEVASKTEGYVAQDLSTLVDRAIHAAWIRLAPTHENSRIVLKDEDFEIALKGLIPASLRGISLQIQDQRTWKDVGGLSNVKKVIQQIIMWPTKYKEMYKNYSLKPQTNILLYGAPGTGKTLLAGVVASECGLNFISIKGPELLSKYIGASEQAVRDLFKRATTARPCILFFDEFDSIAPRRGHDSTGVTDRVVNQLLTQLDGVESLEGVHVLAATSRPELIDPALLRPGRLDKCLHCPLPDKNDRVEILNCLSSKMPLVDEIDFDSIASLTVNFSGADLQALLYTAHIEALHEIQNTSTKRYTSSDDSDYHLTTEKLLFIPSLDEGKKIPSDEDGKKIAQDVHVVQDKYFGINRAQSKRHSTLNVSITQRHLLKVASEMKPSVSMEERLRYDLFFKNFQKVLAGESPVSPGNVKRVTLA